MKVESTERIMTNINKICPQIDTEDISPKWVMADELGTKATRHTYLCPCGVLTIIEKIKELPPKSHSILIKSEKCGLNS